MRQFPGTDTRQFPAHSIHNGTVANHTTVAASIHVLTVASGIESPR